MEMVARTTIRKSNGEYHVRAYSQLGKRMPDSDYFTDDKGDAEDTANAMKEPYRRALAHRLTIARDAMLELLSHDSYVAKYEARDAARAALALLENDDNALMRTDVLSNDELIDLYHETGDRRDGNIAELLRARIAARIITPKRPGDSYWSGAPDYLCQHCGLPGGH